MLGLAALNTALRGIVHSPDSQSYLYWADRLIQSGFDYAGMLSEYGDPAAITYSLFVTLIAVLRMIFGESTALALAALNVLAVAAVGTLVVRLAVRLTGDSLAGWAAGVLFILCYDLWQWSRYILSDSTFLLLAYAVFLMEARRLLGGTGKWTRVFAASTAASLFRPTGIVMFPVTLWSYLLSRPSIDKPRAAAVLFGVGVAGLLAFGWIVADPARLPVTALKPALDKISATYVSGQVVWDRVSTYHPQPTGLLDYWLISGDRLLHFFALGAREFSWVHWLAQAVFFVPAYGFAGWFAVRLTRGKSRLSGAGQSVCYAALGAIVLYALFHAAVQVDYDWRYRVPILPHLILLASCGISEAFGIRRIPDQLP